MARFSQFVILGKTQRVIQRGNNQGVTFVIDKSYQNDLKKLGTNNAFDWLSYCTLFKGHISKAELGEGRTVNTESHTIIFQSKLIITPDRLPQHEAKYVVMTNDVP